MSIVFLDGVCVTLVSNLGKTSTILPVSMSDKQVLIEELGTTGHSYLTARGVTGKREVMKIVANSGEILLTRGDDPLNISSGKCLCFTISKEVLDDYGMGEICQPTITSTDNNIVVTPPENDGCEWKISLSESLLKKLEQCCPEDDCNNCTIADGTYENATITVVNGRVCTIDNGKNIVYTGGSTCCGCSSCTE